MNLLIYRFNCKLTCTYSTFRHNRETNRLGQSQGESNYPYHVSFTVSLSFMQIKMQWLSACKQLQRTLFVCCRRRIIHSIPWTLTSGPKDSFPHTYPSTDTALICSHKQPPSYRNVRKLLRSVWNTWTPVLAVQQKWYVTFISCFISVFLCCLSIFLFPYSSQLALK